MSFKDGNRQMPFFAAGLEVKCCFGEFEELFWVLLDEILRLFFSNI
jgi:hypothetical protein